MKQGANRVSEFRYNSPVSQKEKGYLICCNLKSQQRGNIQILQNTNTVIDPTNQIIFQTTLR